MARENYREQKAIVVLRWVMLDLIDVDTRALWSLLDGPEQARADRFRFVEDRDAYVAAHALLRVMLSEASGTPPREWQFLAFPGGKPYIAPSLGEPELRFSLSHTRGMVACAVARTFELGVDVEACRQTIPVLEMARRLFAPAEMECIERLPAEEQPSMFYRLWTLKEAYAKATGRGITVPLDDFAFLPDPNGVTLSPHGFNDWSTWEFHELKPGPHHRIALAIKLLSAKPAQVDATGLSVKECLRRANGMLGHGLV